MKKLMLSLMCVLLLLPSVSVFAGEPQLDYDDYDCPKNYTGGFKCYVITNPNYKEPVVKVPSKKLPKAPSLKGLGVFMALGFAMEGISRTDAGATAVNAFWDSVDTVDQTGAKIINKATSDTVDYVDGLVASAIATGEDYIDVSKTIYDEFTGATDDAIRENEAYARYLDSPKKVANDPTGGTLNEALEASNLTYSILDTEIYSFYQYASEYQLKVDGSIITNTVRYGGNVVVIGKDSKGWFKFVSYDISTKFLGTGSNDYYYILRKNTLDSFISKGALLDYLEKHSIGVPYLSYVNSPMYKDMMVTEVPDRPSVKTLSNGNKRMYVPSSYGNANPSTPAIVEINGQDYYRDETSLDDPAIGAKFVPVNDPFDETGYITQKKLIDANGQEIGKDGKLVDAPPIYDTGGKPISDNPSPVSDGGKEAITIPGGSEPPKVPPNPTEPVKEPSGGGGGTFWMLLAFIDLLRAILWYIMRFVRFIVTIPAIPSIPFDNPAFYWFKNAKILGIYPYSLVMSFATLGLSLSVYKVVRRFL